MSFYGIDTLDFCENTIKITKITYEYRCLTYIVESNGYSQKSVKTKHILF